MPKKREQRRRVVPGRVNVVNAGAADGHVAIGFQLLLELPSLGGRQRSTELHQRFASDRLRAVHDDDLRDRTRRTQHRDRPHEQHGGGEGRDHGQPHGKSDAIASCADTPAVRNRNAAPVGMIRKQLKTRSRGRLDMSAPVATLVSRARNRRSGGEPSTRSVGDGCASDSMCLSRNRGAHSTTCSGGRYEVTRDCHRWSRGSPRATCSSRPAGPSHLTRRIQSS